MNYETEETEDVDVIEMQIAGKKIGLAGIAKGSGTVYLSGDLHPIGAFGALMEAAKQDVPYMSTGSINALFPSDWLRGECLHDQERLRVIYNMEAFVRTGGA